MEREQNLLKTCQWALVRQSPLDFKPMKILTKKNFLNYLFLTITGISAASVLFIIIGIFYMLSSESYLAIKEFGFINFLTSINWDPVKESFGSLASLSGTTIITVLAMTMGIPLAIGIAIFIVEVAPNKLKGIIGGAIELLAAIPSIIYGMWGFFTLAPLMAKYVEPFLQRMIGNIPYLAFLVKGTPIGIDVFTASVILAIMIIPFTASITKDSFNLTPSIVKESAYAIGATKWEVVKDVVFPYSKFGIFGGVAISLGRALGETMAVAFVLGNKNMIPTSLFDTATTVTVKLANEFTEADTDLYLSSLYYLALLLFVLSFLILAVSKIFLLKAKRES